MLAILYKTQRCISFITVLGVKLQPRERYTRALMDAIANNDFPASS